MCLIFVLLMVSCSGTAPTHTMMTKSGSLGFWFFVPEDYYNGVEPQGDLMKLLEIPGMVQVILDVPSVDAAAAQAEFGAKEAQGKKGAKKPPSSTVNLEWAWTVEDGNILSLFLPLLPGNHWYYYAARWDCEKGLFDAFLNGIALRVPGTTVTPWVITEQTIDIAAGDHVEDIEVSGSFWSESDILKKAGSRPHYDIGPLIGFGRKKPLVDIEKMKGKLLYSADFTQKSDLDQWRMEGPGVYTMENDGWLYMESTEIDVGGPGDGHFVFWAPGVYPADFIAEWEFQPVNDEGLCIAIFSAMGQNGKDIFDSSLKKRDGHFAGYIRGDINCYHISYFANIPTNPGRITSNLRKNAGFYLVSNGPPGVPGGSRDIHKISLVRNNGRIILGVDGEEVINWQDDGKRYGPVYGEGSIALRQMKWMKARYRNFKMWSVSE